MSTFVRLVTSGAAVNITRRVVMAITCLAVFQSFASAQGTISNGEILTGAVTGSQVASWSFYADRGNSTVCAGASVVGPPVSGFVPWLIIYNPDGTVLRALVNGNIAVRVCATPLMQTGMYRVTVRNYFAATQPNLTKTFTVTLALPSKPYVVPNGGSGGWMARGAVYSGTITLAEIGQWSFGATQGDRVTVNMIDPANSPDFVPWVMLFAPDGSDLAGTYNNTTATIVYTVRQTGTYTVLAMDRNPAVVANYTLMIK
jgi:hypothetical protein